MAKSRNAWRIGVDNSRAFYEKHGDLKVPAGFVTDDGYKLGNFIKNTKSNGKMDELLKEVQGEI